MTDVNFYHLQSEPLDSALPRLLEKVCERQLRALIRGQSGDCLENLDIALWTYKPSSFLPHAVMADDVDGSAQPILLTDTDASNPNKADVLVLVEDAPAADLTDFDRCLYLFDGNDDGALAAARHRWKALKDADISVSYFQQSETGWQKKA